MRDRATLAKQIYESGMNEEDFQIEFRQYAKSFVPSQNDLKEEFKEMTLGSSDEFKYSKIEDADYSTKIEVLKENLSMMSGDEVSDITGNTLQEVFDGYCNRRINSISLAAAEVSIFGIQQAWSDPDINNGKPGMLVTKQDLNNPNNYSSSSSLINAISIEGADPVTEDELRNKLQYANIKNPKSTSLILVGIGTEHTALLAVDPSTKQYRYIDSKNNDIDPSLDNKLKKVLPDYLNISTKTPKTQQNDTSTSAYWVLKNAQTVAQGGISTSMYCNINILAMQEEINKFGVTVQGAFVDRIITINKAQQYKPVLEVSPIPPKMRSGYLIQEVQEINSPMSTPSHQSSIGHQKIK